MRKLTGFLLLASTSWAADYKAGVSRRIITPDKPIYLSGYANRNRPSEGKITTFGPRRWLSKTPRAAAS